ncbi:Putative Phage related protein (plasmid) [Planktothrix tepida]|uniref:Putative Phage related protein n=1 Tax=Planktothrix tepida PCC 9214 TaxID=671072 RepID=A0A1J1LNX8_9CYAN|nr:DUF4326 domain-containing protein [Planktothrix tepida]CAD5988722.1 Putative Phage related protein [Planktothrix tepida]CUR33950.1 putative Phage related protein [Planktothrix tepida PCC 9214]
MKVINGKIDGFIGSNKIYIGRYNRYYNLKESPLYNPYPITKTVNRNLAMGYARLEAIALYKQHLWNSIKAMRDGLPLDRIMIELINIARVEKDLAETHTELMLVCYCSPLPCHGDVIVAAIGWLKTQDWFMENWI